MQEKLGKDWILLIKQHPVVKQRPEVPKECQSFAYDVSDAFVIEELLCVSDLCISDYSSLVFEYSLFERPMLFLPTILKNMESGVVFTMITMN